MFKAIFKAIFGFVQFAANRIRAWIPQVAASLILFGYLGDALQAMLQLRMHAHHMAMLMNGWETIGVIYMLLDIAIILTGTVLIAYSCDCNDGSGNGVAMLWLQRTLRTLAFSIWDYELLLHYCVDVGCLLLLLLAMRQSQRQATAGVCWQHDRQQQRSLQRLLSVARIGMCCVCLLWIVEPHQLALERKLKLSEPRGNVVCGVLNARGNMRRKSAASQVGELKGATELLMSFGHQAPGGGQRMHLTSKTQREKRARIAIASLDALTFALDLKPICISATPGGWRPGKDMRIIIVLRLVLLVCLVLSVCCCCCCLCVAPFCFCLSN
ncbi:uncharacterized protein LOC132798855 isoform X1 [Drosophila nasuta]|uniref:uncharacterized protein LOC132798855 isoform X1 n=1 Tax=Drosophila nasuta TaxID=42062 RepID=UPI00295ED503|nr:uncharacterized protein LOC132798855 isoform X1 [Drosophila nasuta]